MMQPPAPNPMMSGPAPTPPKMPVTIDAVMALLKDGALRRFRVDIETDSTIVGDESQERRDRNEFILSVTQFVQGWGPLITANPKLARMAGDLLMFGVRAYRVGRELEETIEDTVEQIDQAAQQPQPPPPQMLAEQAKLEAAKMKAQAEIQKAQMAAEQSQQESQAKIMAIQASAEQEAQKHQLEVERMHVQLEHERQKHEMEMQRMAQGHQIEADKFAMARQQEEANAEKVAQKEEKDRAASHEHSAKLGEAIAANTQAIPMLANAIVEHGKHFASGMNKPRRVIRDKDGKVSGVE